MDKDYGKAVRAAFRVEFLQTSEELFMYARAIYAALKWGKGIDEAATKNNPKNEPAKKDCP